MSGQQPPKPIRPLDPLDAIDFELTDFDSARRVLDELPPGVAEVKNLETGYWAQKRARPQPTDRALTGASMDWVMGLPAALRPHTMCEQFPRVANAIAATWSDAAYSLRVIDHMINDYRGGRRGFPDAVKRELHVLFEHQRARSGG